MQNTQVKRIHLLDSSVSNKIAAGEVVERPAAVVKELVENAIDAGATHILIEIEAGGKSLIRVTDDGCGITPEDLPLAFMRHATSKVVEVDDLYHLTTLGFRGEALASIAAVSQVTLTTRRQEDAVGTYIEVSGGALVDQREVAAQQGTSLAVKDLFFNTPARLKFLRSNPAETASISDLVTRLAISNPQISFKYFVDQRQIWMTPGDGDRFKAIYAVFEKELAKNLMAFEVEEASMKVSGFISKLNYVRSTRSHQIFFINGRFVRSRTLSDAIASAYTGLLPIGRFPACVLYLELSPDLVDVNIHPQKTEVKFDNEYRVRDLLSAAVRKALHRELNPPEVKPVVRAVDPSIVHHEPTVAEKNVQREGVAERNTQHEGVVEKNVQREQVSESSVASKPVTVNEPRRDKEPVRNEEPLQETPETYAEISPQAAMKNPLPKRFDHTLFQNLTPKDFEPEMVNSDGEGDLGTEEAPTSPEPVYRESLGVQESFLAPVAESLYDHLKYIGQAFASFLIFEREGKLYWIDQHAAHEKLLYERLKRDFKSHKVIRQILVKPIVIEVDHGTLQRVTEACGDLEHIGFVVEPFGSDSLVIREVPMAFSAPKASAFMDDLMPMLGQKKVLAEDIWMDKIIKAACKGAIKANDVLDAMEVKKLVEDLKELESPYTCPHGRPIIVAMSRTEIEKMFKRT